MVGRSPEPFPETPYGIVKRLRTIEAWTDRVVARLRQTSLSILDYGCGTGDHVTHPLACRSHQVLGVDCHEASIRQASRTYPLPNLSFRRADIGDLVREAMTFDLIVCSEVLEHLHDPREFLQAVRRLLRPGGGLIITTPNGYGSFEWLMSLQKGLNRIGLHGLLRRAASPLLGAKTNGQARPDSTGSVTADPSIGYLNMDSTHVQFFRLGRLETIFAESGFRILDRRARTLCCGPYVDLLFRALPFEQALYRMNNRLADLLPFAWAADWMFFLEAGVE